MEAQRKDRPRVPSGFAIPNNGSSMESETRGAKNLWEYKKDCQNTTNVTKLSIASYNANTLSSEEKLEELHYELSKIKWDVVGLSEVRRPGEQCLRLHDGHTLYYRGSDSGKCEHGIAILVHKRLKNYIKTIDTVSDRVMYVVLQMSRKITLKIVHMYAPTGKTPAVLAKVDQVHEEVSACLQNNRTTYSIVIGDFNAKLGERLDDSETMMGKFGHGKRNERGHILANFLEQENLYHMSSFFKKRSGRKWTWVSPGARYRNEIDYVFSSNKCIVQDVTVLNRFYTGSDHRLVRALIKINTKLERYAKINKKRPKIDPLYLKVNSELYQQGVENKLKSNSSAILNTDDSLEHLTKSLIEVATQIASNSKARAQKIQGRTKELLEERRALINQRLGHTTHFKDICRKARQHLEEDIKAHRERIVRDTIDKYKGPKIFQKALSSGTQQITKLWDKHNTLVTEQNQLLKTIEEYYQDLYKSKNPKPSNTIERKVTNVGSEDVPEITNTEIKTALAKMSNGKAPGDDSITVEMLKEGGEVVISFLRDLFNKCLEDSRVPAKWECATVILLFKKGNKCDLNNYRPISLLSQLYKLFIKIITLRLTKKLDFYQPLEQAGFRSGLSTIDHILAMRIVIEKTTEYQMPLWVAFIDYKKAFDSIESWAVIESLQNARIDYRYTNLIRGIYENAGMRVNLPPETEEIKIERGVRQGDPISPKLFTLVLEDVFKKLNWDKYGLCIEGKRLNNLRFADDIVLFSETPEELQTMIQELNNASRLCGLEMNLNKTKIMTNCEDATFNIKVDDTIIEKVQKYVYLGQEVVMGKENQTNEIHRRIRLAWAAYSKIDYVFKMTLTPEQKARIHDQCILPVLTYGAETWVFTKEIIHKLRVTQRAIERKLVGVSLKDRKRNEWLREKSKVTDVITRIAKLKWQWAGHVARKHDSWCKKLVEWRPWGEKRPQGRPQMRWYDDIKRIAGVKWIEKAQDREKWHKLKEAYTLMVEKG